MNLLRRLGMALKRDDPAGRQRVRDERMRRNFAITEQLHEASVEARTVAQRARMATGPPSLRERLTGWEQETRP